MKASLEDLLDLIRDALLAGDLASLPALTALVETATDTCTGLELAAAQRIKAKADRNGRLLQSAVRGVRSAQARLSQIAAGPTLATYDAHGRRALVPQVSVLPPKRF